MIFDEFVKKNARGVLVQHEMRTILKTARDLGIKDNEIDNICDIGTSTRRGWENSGKSRLKSVSPLIELIEEKQKVLSDQFDFDERKIHIYANAAKKKGWILQFSKVL